MFDVQKFQRLRKGKFGEAFFFYPEIDSTNRIALEKAREGSPEGSAIVADCQTQGRGRGNHSWFSPAGVNLYLSLILYPPQKKLHYLPFFTAIALSDTLEEWKLSTDLKWPNDILVHGKKIAGILIQTATEENRLQFSVVGIGVNLNMETIPAALQATAVSAAQILGSFIDREAFLASLLRRLEQRYQSMESWDELVKVFQQRSSFVRDCSVVVEMEGRRISGVTAGMDAMGGLIVQTSSGEEIVYAGEISSCRKN